MSTTKKKIISLEVRDEYILGSGVAIGAVGSFDSVVLRVKFDDSWLGLNRYATWSDALGNVGDSQIVTVLDLVDGDPDTYDILVPAFATQYAGTVKLALSGYVIGGEAGNEIESLLNTVSGAFRVLESNATPLDTGETSATVAQQVLDNLNKAIELRTETELKLDDAEKKEAARMDAEAIRQSNEEARIKKDSERDGKIAGIEGLVGDVDAALDAQLTAQELIIGRWRGTASRVFTGKWQWNDAIRLWMEDSYDYDVWISGESQFTSNGEKFDGISFDYDWEKLCRVLKYKTETGDVIIESGNSEENYVTPSELYRVIDFGDGCEVDDDADGAIVNNWLLSNITRCGTVAEKMEQITKNDITIRKYCVVKDACGNIPLNDDETFIQDRMPVAVSGMAVAYYIDDVVDMIGAEKMKYYGDADIEISDESLFKFTLLDDGTYSIGAKKVRDLEGHIVLPYKYNGKLVTEITASGFADHRDKSQIQITGVTIPRTIRKIGQSAFPRCNIAEITIPGSCKEIGTTAFYRSMMKKIVLEEGVEIIGKSTFQECHEVTHCVIPSTINGIWTNSFEGARQEPDVYYTGSQEGFESTDISDGISHFVLLYDSNDMSLGPTPLKNCLKDWIWQANIYYNYGNDEAVSKATTDNAKNIETNTAKIETNTTNIAANAVAIEALKTAVSKGIIIKERVLYSGQKFYIHPNSFYVAMPPTKNLALYYGDGRADDPYQNYKIGLIGGVSSEVNEADGRFRSATLIQYEGGLLGTDQTAIYAYFYDNAAEIEGGTGAYLKWNGGSGTYCPILYSVPVTDSAIPTEDDIGDIKAALDSIIAIQESLIGGNA